jgi:hypothetical protein
MKTLWMNKIKLIGFVFGCLFCLSSLTAQEFELNSNEYFELDGVNVMAFQDNYAEGHQSGIIIIQHGMRIATNGDIRLDRNPGQWQPIPVQKQRLVNRENNTVHVTLSYPDSSRHLKGFNPIVYPDLHFNYSVQVKAHGESVIVTVDLDRPLPEEFAGKVGFNLELYPDLLFGKTWIMDNQVGMFTVQPNGPLDTKRLQVNKPLNRTLWVEDEVLPKALATGSRLTIAPETELTHLTVESVKTPLSLYDGRINHNNGWFILRSEIPSGATTNAVEWIITPKRKAGWIQEPVIQVSQIGYHPDQSKKVFIELDKKDRKNYNIEVIKVNVDGEKTVLKKKGKEWGNFLRYRYLTLDFSEIKNSGIYKIKYGNTISHPFRIAPDIYKENVWQPVIEYFLPVQMCHMRVNEKYRVWHGLCHMDDALMAPVNHNHFDGYVQGEATLTKYKPGEHVPGLNIGGWHDAGDYDLRIESQSYEIYILGLIYEEFKPDYDVTSIDQHSRIVEIHQPDGKPDILQQIEHGVLSIVGGYKSLGRLYRGIIDPTLRQYVLLGDGANTSDNLFYDENLKERERTATHSSVNDDRWVFTEDNPYRELSSASHLAQVARILKGYNDTLALHSLEIAEEIFMARLQNVLPQSIELATELYLTTRKDVYRKFILDNEKMVLDNWSSIGWVVGKVLPYLNSREFTGKIRKEMEKQSRLLSEELIKTPYDIPYEPRFWGAGWAVESFGVRQYFLYKSFPDLVDKEPVFSALNFMLGCHPGSNTASFVSGVGSKSVTSAYGINRADRSFIPGGVVSGTALIAPDFAELLDYPYLWQQTEYVLGGGSSNFVFLTLAVNELLKKKR